MQITRVSLWVIPLRSHADYFMGGGKSCITTDSVIVRVDTDGGLSGWGESCPIPHYLPAFAGGISPAIDYMMPAILHADPLGAESLMAKLDRYLIGHGYAKSPLDMAFWDITAQSAKLPLYRLLGGRQSDAMPVYHSLTCIDPHEMAAMAREAKQSGVTQFQVKLGADNDWQADIARVRLVREAVGEEMFVYADWNCSASKLDAIRTARAVADLDLMLEQPCESMEECASVKRATGLPIKLDEVINTPSDIIRAHQADCLDMTALKVARMGGLSATRRARDLCVHLGVKMCIEDTWGSDIATAALLHLACSTDPKYLQNVCDLSGYVAPRLAGDGPTRKDGHISPGDGIGLGVTPDMDLLGEPHSVWN